MTDYHEKEIKLELKSFDKIVKILKKQDAEFIGSAFQRTLRYDTEDDELQKKWLFLRLRSGFSNTLTLKIKVDNKEVFERKEIELEIDDIESMRRILKNLGYSKERIMEKYRSMWKINGVEICLDELPFGFFIEIEGDEKKIFEVAENLGLDVSSKIIVTYWDLFEKYKKEKGIIGKDIVFDEDYESKIKI
jgi:adenylate cyclase class 2